MESEDLRKAIAVFLIAFGARMPPDMKASIRQRVYQLADEVERAGEPSVGRLARGLADALDSPPGEPSH